MMSVQILSMCDFSLFDENHSVLLIDFVNVNVIVRIHFNGCLLSV